MGNRRLTTAVSGIARLAAADLGSIELRQSVVAQLRSAVGFDAWCFALVDPLNRVATHSVAADAPGLGDRQRRFFQILHTDEGVARVLASTPSGRVGVLSAATDGDLTRSALWREVHRPSGLGDALFAGVADHGTYWGHLSLYRHADAPAFTVDDAARVHAAIAPIGPALRRASLRPVDVMPFVDDAPGTLLLDADLRILGATPMAARWVRDQVPGDAPAQVPAVVAALVAETDASAESATERRPSVRMRAANGEWLVVSVARLDGHAAGQIVVTVERARPAEVLPILVAAYGLSSREGRLVELVLGGMSTAEIADALFISRYTVQDHLKSVFGKVGVSSRRELAGQLFGW